MSILDSLRPGGSLRPGDSVRPKRSRAESQERLKAVEAKLEAALADHKAALEDNVKAGELLKSVRPCA